MKQHSTTSTMLVHAITTKEPQMHRDEMVVLDQMSYDIEQLWIEGHGPAQIASELDCSIEVIREWLDQENLVQQGCRGYAC